MTPDTHASWHARLLEAGRVAVDTNALIYFLDLSPVYYPLMAAAFGLAEDGHLEIVVPTLVEVELLVGLMRSGDERNVARLRLLLDGFKGLEIAPLDRAAATEAARIRASTGLSTPDALVIGTALAAGCRAVIGNDLRCARRITVPTYLCLSDYQA